MTFRQYKCQEEMRAFRECNRYSRSRIRGRDGIGSTIEEGRRAPLQRLMRTGLYYSTAVQDIALRNPARETKAYPSRWQTQSEESKI